MSDHRSTSDSPAPDGTPASADAEGAASSAAHGIAGLQAGPRGTRRSVLVATSVCTVIAIAVAVILTARSGSSSGADNGAVRSSASATSSATDAISEASLLPATLDDVTAGGYRLQNFRTRVETKANQDCFAKAGHPVALPQPTQLGTGDRLVLFDDPAALDSVGFDGPAARSAMNAPAPGSTTTGLLDGVPADVQSQCFSATNSATTSALGPVLDLTGKWMNEVHSLESDQAVVAAMSQWASCLSAAGYPVKNEADWFQLVDHTTMTAADAPTSRRTMASADAQCLRASGLADTRAKVRAGARIQFEQANAELYGQVQRALPGAIAALSSKYGIDY